MRYLFFIMAIAVSATMQGQHQLVKKWESDSIFKVPESVLYDADHQLLYISNIEGKDPWAKDGLGSIGVNADKTLSLIVDGMEGGVDGLEPFSDNEYIVSAWGGVVYFVDTKTKTKQLLLDGRPQYGSGLRSKVTLILRAVVDRR